MSTNHKSRLHIPKQRRAVLDAAVVAGVPNPQVMDVHAAIATCYNCKHMLSAIGAKAPARHVAFLDVGYKYCTFAVYRFEHAKVQRRLLYHPRVV